MNRLLALLSSLLAFSATAQPDPARPAPPQLAAVRVERGSITVDGHLDEAAWARAPAATDFVQRAPTPAAPARQATDARVLIDGAAVYVGMRMHDTDAAAIVAPLSRRDAVPSSDVAIVAFDPYHDGQTGLYFTVNPAGVKADYLLFDDTRSDGSWDAVWDAAVSRDSAGWTAEFRIPLGQLRYTPGNDTWGLQFARDVQRTGERSFWAPILPDVNGFVSRFGTLTGMAGLNAPRRLEVVPYVASQGTRAPDTRTPERPANPYYAPTDVAARAGVDLKLGLSSNLTLTATINPDFGQVEADPAQVYLGGFELFLGERRPFFVEGRDALSFGQTRANVTSNRPQLLYTRRIGRSPQRQGFVPGDVVGLAGEQGVVYSDAPQQTTILGAAKLTGRVGRVTVGALSAVTAPEYGHYQAFDETGTPVADGRGLVEPLASYSAARARVALGRTLVGAAGTLVVRDLSDPVFSSLLPRQASVLEADVEHVFGQWVASGTLAGSLVTGSTDALVGLQTAFPRLYQRPDAGYLGVDSSRTSLGGVSAEVALNKASGTHWRGSVAAAYTSPGFDANSLGYQNRADFGYVNAFASYSQNAPHGILQRWNANAYGLISANRGGDVLDRSIGVNAAAQHVSFWEASAHADVQLRGISDRLTRGSVLARTPLNTNANLGVNTDPRRAVSASFGLYASVSEIGLRSARGSAGLTVRPAANLTLGLAPNVSSGRYPRQFLTAFSDPAAAGTFGRRTVFADVHLLEVSAEARVNWTFTPDLSLQLYARPFVSHGRYDRFQEPTAPRQLRFPTAEEAGGTVERLDDGRVRVTPGDGGRPYTLSPDFTVRALQGNAVLRWEYRPGSTLFFVWQQQREGFEPAGAFRLDHALGGLATDPLTNVFLLKLTYWLG